MKNIILIPFLLVANLATAQNLPDHVADFLQWAEPYAHYVEVRFNIPAEVTLAVACLESGYGQSSNAKEKNNYFGIKDAGGEWQEYTSALHCFNHFGIILSLPRYKVLKDIPSDRPADYFLALQLCGYCPSATYAQKLLNTAKFCKLLND